MRREVSAAQHRCALVLDRLAGRCHQLSCGMPDFAVPLARRNSDGAIPLSAQLGNAISNDGDALFPAIAKAPKAAVPATLYSALPAVFVAYGAYALGW